MPITPLEPGAALAARGSTQGPTVKSTNPDIATVEGIGTERFVVAGGHQFTSISLGSRFTCGLTSGGAAYCWGDFAWGNFSWLGTASRDGSFVPVAAAPIFP